MHTSAQCLPCRKKVEILRPIWEGMDGKHPYVTGKCPVCLRAVRRWLRKTEVTPSPNDASSETNQQSNKKGSGHTGKRNGGEKRSNIKGSVSTVPTTS